jgi:hypothetical protein
MRTGGYSRVTTEEDDTDSGALDKQGQRALLQVTKLLDFDI